MSKDYYKILGVDKSATPDQIKSAYKKLAVKHHPDVNKESGAEAKFKEINEAYQVLSDPQKKSNYDQFGSADMGGAGGGQGFGGFSQGFNFNGEDMGGFDDIFDVFFGGGRNKRKKENRGRDVEILIELEFKEAIFGIEKDLSYSVMSRCPECGGAGGSNPKQCPECGGSGYVSRTTRTILGSFAQNAPCSKCHGKGEIPENICRKCSGSGTSRQTKDIKVKIPAGVNDGSAIRVAGGGEAGDDGEGDLYLRIRVKPSKEFEREDQDIFSDLEISFPQATLGDKVKVETVDGFVDLTIPAGTASHTRFRLKGKGVPYPNQRGTRGDHYVTIKLIVPKKISREERELLEKMRNISN
jgi:molecular chaperone DnaJ